MEYREEDKEISIINPIIAIGIIIAGSLFGYTWSWIGIDL